MLICILTKNVNTTCSATRMVNRNSEGCPCNAGSDAWISMRRSCNFIKKDTRNGPLARHYRSNGKQYGDGCAPGNFLNASRQCVSHPRCKHSLNICSSDGTKAVTMQPSCFRRFVRADIVVSAVWLPA